MTNQTITVSREELYEQVWSTPMAKLAIQYQMSDTGLAKICKNMNIPRPGRGYWARVQNGAKIKRTRLPKLSTSKQSQVSFHLKDSVNREASERLYKFKNLPTVKFDSEAKFTHPLVVKTLSFLKNADVNDKGLVLPAQEGILNIKVGKAQIERALLIMQSVAEVMEKHGYKLCMVTKRDRCLSYFLVDEQQVYFSVEERYRRIDHVLTREELKRKKKAESNRGFHGINWDVFDFFVVPKYDYVPSGELSFVIDTPNWYNNQRRWKDAPTKRLENRINAVLVGLMQTADDLKAWQLEENKREDEVRREEEEQQRLQELYNTEQKKIKALTKQTKLWHKSQQMRAYLVEVEKKFAIRTPTQEEREWFEWAKIYVDYLDPLVDSAYEPLSPPDEDGNSMAHSWHSRV